MTQTAGIAPLARAEFALDPGLTYFNHAAVGVLPVATRDALRGTPNFIGVLSLATKVGVLRRAGIARIGEHVPALTDRLVEGLQRKNAVVDGERSAATSSGIVTTNRPSGIRVSPHGYNTSDEIDALLELL